MPKLLGEYQNLILFLVKEFPTNNISFRFFDMMNKREIFRKIGGIISELTEQYQYLSDNFEDFNELELELFAANSHFLNEHIEILKKLASNGATRVESKVATPPAPEIKATPVIRPEESNPEPKSENFSVIEKPKDEVKVDSSPVIKSDLNASKSVDIASKSLDELYKGEFEQEEDEIDFKRQMPGEEVKEHREPPSIPFNAPAPVDTKQEEIVVNTVVIPEKTISVQTNPVSEKPAVMPTINDIISSQAQKSTVSTTFTQQPVADLKSIISLNDKLLFIKDLFNGYSLAYSEAIEILNRFDSFEAADHFLRSNYAEKNQWISKQSTVDKFFTVLARRYSK